MDTWTEAFLAFVHVFKNDATVAPAPNVGGFAPAVPAPARGD